MVYTKEFILPDYNIDEIKRYIGARDDKTDFLIDECIKECHQNNVFCCRVCYKTADVLFCDQDVVIDGYRFGGTLLKSKFSKKTKALLFAATTGIGIDRLISKYSLISPSKALVFQGIGAERIECLCDMFCDSKKEEYPHLSSRISPGYSDFDISFQKHIFEILDCERKIGLHLSDSLMMTPTKSVTAIMAID